jgi:molybdopterin-binding protein
VVVQDALAIELNALNQLKGTVISVKLGGIMAEVAVDVGGQEMVSARRHG